MRKKATRDDGHNNDGGPYGRYLERVRETLGDRAAGILGDLARPEPITMLLLSGHVVPYDMRRRSSEEADAERTSPEALEFAENRDRGTAGLALLFPERITDLSLVESSGEDARVASVSFGDLTKPAADRARFDATHDKLHQDRVADYWTKERFTP